MPLPPLLNLAVEADYRAHFEQAYCRRGVVTHDGIRVYFRRDRFDHAFYESTRRDGVKDAFSLVRAQRLGWIGATLTNPDADRYQGWSKVNRRYDPARRVSVAYEDFVVVLGLSLSGAGDLKAHFITCYQADNSIGKIRSSPVWTLQECLDALR